jgi:hypothetical protein
MKDMPTKPSAILGTVQLIWVGSSVFENRSAFGFPCSQSIAAQSATNFNDRSFFDPIAA